MANIWEELDPQPVFKYFAEISNIPRGSGNEKEISDYLVAFARKRGLEAVQDEALNVMIYKPPYPGYENAPPVIIQGHMDMVCDKNNDTEHDFEKDPIKLRVEGDMLYASNTTLGADNGIAVAYALALLDSDDIPHPPLEVLITTEEEVGLKGAARVDASALRGNLLINLDSEGEGTLTTGCAGGVRARQSLKIRWEALKDGLIPYSIAIRGLKGGHSGGEIHLGRGNSNKLMGRLLNGFREEIEYYISELNGGLKTNAIPREADAIILIREEDMEKLEAMADFWDKTFKNELRVSDPGVHVTLRKLDWKVDRVFSKETMEKAIASLVLIPNGVQTMSRDIEGLVESSTNLGVVKTHDNELVFESAIRSCVKSLKYSILNVVKTTAASLGEEISTDSDYPEWEFNPDSKLRVLLEEVYEKMYGKKPEIMAVHGGLECGMFKEKKPELDMVCMGPDMYGAHTPDEHLSISSTKRTWEYLLAVLKEVK